ncbi:tRNA (adenosine(37)-N6)-threonylcarbamoyltransferase complex dimerization subunit type 1 TsaB [soil metagenome]
MLLLGIDTSTMQTGVRLGSERGVQASATLARGQSHVEFLVPAIDFCLSQASLTIRDVNGVAVSIGPGLFTGMRVGIATAQALAHARGLPAVGLPSLDLLAFAARPSARLVYGVLDARRGELFWASYRHGPDGMRRLTGFRVGPAERLAGEIEARAEDVVCVGDGALAHATLLGSVGAEVGPAAVAHPGGESLAQLARPRFAGGETHAPEDLRPVYVRQPDARINWRNRGALLGGVR